MRSGSAREAAEREEAEEERAMKRKVQQKRNRTLSHSRTKGAARQDGGGRARKTRKPRAGGLFRARRKGAFVRAAMGIKFFPLCRLRQEEGASERKFCRTKTACSGKKSRPHRIRQDAATQAKFTRTARLRNIKLQHGLRHSGTSCDFVVRYGRFELARLEGRFRCSKFCAGTNFASAP